MDLFGELVFRTVENCHALFAGEESFVFKCCSLHCTVRDFLTQGQLSVSHWLLNMISNDGDIEDNLDEKDTSDFFFEIEKGDGNNSRRRKIQCQVSVDAELDTVWGILTDYEGLADFIPSLAVCRLLDKKDKFAKLYQVGQQDLAFGLKFNAQGVIECYEGDLELLTTGQMKRDIDFNMVDGDFHIFQGKWSIQQAEHDMKNATEIFEGNGFQTTLIYTVELEPKLWLPVGLIEGRICREIKNNLLSVKEEAQRIQKLRGQMFET